MTRLQATLVLALGTLVAVAFGRLAWPYVGPSLSMALAAVPSLLTAVPGWAWWTAFGVAMALKGTLLSTRYGWGCRSASHHACRRSPSSQTA